MHDSDIVVRRALLVTALAVVAACADKHAVAPNLVTAVGTSPSHILQPVASGYAQIGAGRNHTCALYNNRTTVYCWGDNRAGEAPAAFTPKLGSVVQLAVGSQHNCVLVEAGIVECWGSSGQPFAPVEPRRSAAHGIFRRISAGGYHDCGITSEGWLECWGSNEYGQAQTFSSQVHTFVQVSAGFEHTCVTIIEGEVLCMGRNDFGQVGIPVHRPATGGRFTSVAAGGNHTCALTSEGVVECWGDNSASQAPAVKRARSGTFTHVAAGFDHTCAISTAEMIECWGRNGYDESPEYVPLSGVSRVSLGGAHTCVLTTSSDAFCFGSNDFLQSSIAIANAAVTSPIWNGDRLASEEASGALPRLSQLEGGMLRGEVVAVGRGCGGDPYAADPGGKIALIERGVCTFGDKIARAQLAGSVGVIIYNSVGSVDPEAVISWIAIATTPTTFTIPAVFVARSTGLLLAGAPAPVTAQLRSTSAGIRLNPRADFVAPSPVNEGAAYILSLTNATVPGFSGDAAFTYAFDCGDGNGYEAASATNAAPCRAAPDNGARSVRGMVTDRHGDFAEYAASITIDNVAPSFAPAPSLIPSDASSSPGVVTFRRSFQDPGTADTWTVTVDYGDGGGPREVAFTQYTPEQTGGAYGGGQINLSHQYLGNGSYVVHVTVRDDDGGSVEQNVDVIVSHMTSEYTPPGSDVPVTPTDQTTGEPSPVDLTFGNVTQPGTTTVTSSPVGQGGGPPVDATFRLGSPATYYDITTTATYSGTIRVCIDYSGATFGNEAALKLWHFEGGSWVDVTASGYPDMVNDVICGDVTSLSPFLVAFRNSAPVVTSLTLSAAAASTGTSVSLSTTFTDVNSDDVHTAIIEWGDGSSSTAFVTENAGSGSATASHAYARAGLYDVRVTVSDGSLTGTKSAAELPGYVVVYDAQAGSLSGGGWIDSPAGAYPANPAMRGKASFSVVAAYRNGMSPPIGNLEFHVDGATFRFRSTSYSWLVVTDRGVKLAGTGTIAGVRGTFAFQLTAVPAERSGRGGALRMKVWDATTGEIVYDNQALARDTDFDATALGGGSITVHR